MGGQREVAERTRYGGFKEDKVGRFQKRGIGEGGQQIQGVWGRGQGRSRQVEEDKKGAKRHSNGR